MLRQAWRDRVSMCLVLNKVERLVTELELTPSEAYERLQRVVEQVNAAAQSLVAEEVRGRRTPDA